MPSKDMPAPLLLRECGCWADREAARRAIASGFRRRAVWTSLVFDAFFTERWYHSAVVFSGALWVLGGAFRNRWAIFAQRHLAPALDGPGDRGARCPMMIC
jgi:hypothetical protein